MSPRRPSALSLARGAALALAVPVLGVVSTPAAQAAVGDEIIAWVEVEDGVISGGPALNSGDHGNFSGTGSYTFRETGMQSTMTVDAPVAGTYPIHIRYAAGPLSAEENVTRGMGLLVNGGARKTVPYPITSMENWEAWRFATSTVTLQQGRNEVALQCDRGQEICRLNFDAIQVGGTAPDPCPAIAPTPGYTSLFDGTFASFDGWRKAAGGGFGRQTDCTIKGVRGRGATWNTTQRTGPYTLRLDWRRTDASDESTLYVGSGSRDGAGPSTGFAIPIGTRTGAIDPANGTPGKNATASAVTEALHPVGEWNSYAVQLTGSLVKVILNGTTINTYVNPNNIPLTGFVGLENRGEGHDVSFRNIQIKPGVAPDTVDSTTTVSAAPASVTTAQGTASVSVKVASATGTPTGQVEVWVDGVKHSTVALTSGAATATVGPFATAGTKSVEARYLGDAATNPSQGATSVTVTDAVVVPPAPAKAASTLKVKLTPSKIVAGRTVPRLTATVTAPGVTPTGTVKVKVGARTYSGTLRGGKVTLKLAKPTRPGTVKVTASYAGDAATAASSTTAKLTVKKAPRK
jgi:hypothetical protein